MPNTLRFSGGYPCHFFVTVLLRALDHFVARQVSAGGRVIAHHRHPDVNDGFRFGLDRESCSRAKPPPISITARIMFGYAEQRQMCPASAAFT